MSKSQTKGGKEGQTAAEVPTSPVSGEIGMEERVEPNFLLKNYNHPPMPGSGACWVYRIIPPREAATDPDLLTESFVTISSIIANYAGEQQMAGGRDLNDSQQARREAAIQQERTAWLNQLDLT